MKINPFVNISLTNLEETSSQNPFFKNFLNRESAKTYKPKAIKPHKQQFGQEDI
jgi:hypothetical protein